MPEPMQANHKLNFNPNPKNVIMLRIQEEEKAYSNTLNQSRAEDSYLQKLTECLGPKENTIIPMLWLQQNAVQYQANLEHISDFLSHGPGKWWFVDTGVEFFDMKTSGLNTLHSEYQMFICRSTTMADIDLYL